MSLQNPNPRSFSVWLRRRRSAIHREDGGSAGEGPIRSRLQPLLLARRRRPHLRRPSSVRSSIRSVFFFWFAFDSIVIIIQSYMMVHFQFYLMLIGTYWLYLCLLLILLFSAMFTKVLVLLWTTKKNWVLLEDYYTVG